MKFEFLIFWIIKKYPKSPIFLIPYLKKIKEKREIELRILAQEMERQKSMRAYRGKICHEKLIERLKNANRLKEAREKRIRKAKNRRERLGFKERRKHEGLVIDDALINHETEGGINEACLHGKGND